MKKSTFTAILLGSVSGLVFALGMCMVLLPDWDLFVEGIICGAVGFLLGIVTLIVWRRMTHKPPIRIEGKYIAAVALGIVGALLLGLGMCFCMVWDMMILGIAIGVLGILSLFFLIPVLYGLKD